ncbi:MAG: hypothetical protein OHK0046_06830 [Anaerolineae bacterium]
MPEITLKDILIGARQESYRMRHYYLGIEHLFIAMLSIKGSLTGVLIQEQGLTPEYVIDAVRRKIGKGSKHRLWAGIPNTPRTEKILDDARNTARTKQREEVHERDLLKVILNEADSLPVRVLHALTGKDLQPLIDLVETYKPNNDSRTPYVRVEYGADFGEQPLTRDQLLILRRMFYEYSSVRVERRLTGGYSKAVLLVVTPIHIDARQDASVVVKIDHVDAILDEARRYDLHVKARLPALTARLEDKPTAPETSDMAGIKYTLVANGDQIPQDLRAILKDWDAVRLGKWLKEALFPSFGPIWWKQHRPFRFQVWREYDWLLPPILTLERVDESLFPADGLTLSLPLRRLKIQGIEYGEIVSVKNFIVQRVYPERSAIQLAAGQGTEADRAYKIEFRNVDMRSDTYYRGEVIENMVGRVWQTRNEQLLHAVRALEPDFDPKADKLPISIEGDDKLPNPIMAYEDLLESYVNGALSTIHGDLHPGNIMIGPHESAFLIDFANTRDGHTIFDWATLEISLLADAVGPSIGERWEDVRGLVPQLHKLNAGKYTLETLPPLLASIGQIRAIASQCLAAEGDWSEYFVALAFCGIRSVSWQERPVGSRRLMFLASALAVYALRTRTNSRTGVDLSNTDTDLNADERTTNP